MPVGTCWIMAVYDALASYGRGITTAPSTSASRTYASALPAMFPSSSISSGSAFNDYAIYP